MAVLMRVLALVQEVHWWILLEVLSRFLEHKESAQGHKRIPKLEKVPGYQLQHLHTILLRFVICFIQSRDKVCLLPSMR